jgi:hypothetical protein
MTQGMSLNDENVKARGGYTVLMKLPAHRAGLAGHVPVKR